MLSSAVVLSRLPEKGEAMAQTIPDADFAVVNRALDAIRIDIARDRYLEHHDIRLVAHAALFERANRMWQEREWPKEHPAILAKGIPGPTLVTWRFHRLAQGLHELNRWGSAYLPSRHQTSIEYVRSLIADAASDDLELTVDICRSPPPSIDDAAMAAIKAELLLLGWRGRQTIHTIFEAGQAPRIELFDTMGHPNIKRAMETLSDNYIKHTHATLGVSGYFSVVTTKNSAATWIDEKRKELRHSSEEQMVAAMVPLTDARKLDEVIKNFQTPPAE
ncbi:MAG: hypothetical protein NUV56_02840 [Candidatus Uhrbacteria bacterium]|nr:hypothetical protein [Candidatus Uhrbacteria bacterium]